MGLSTHLALALLSVGSTISTPLSTHATLDSGPFSGQNNASENASTGTAITVHNTTISENGNTVLNFQVAPPVLSPPETPDSQCVVTLVDYIFQDWDSPFVGTYKPPSCTFDRVVLNFTLHTFGSQYDRLGVMFLGDNEVFRTTTQEPAGNDIAYTHWKEVDQYLPLWKSDQKVIFHMPTIVTAEYTGKLYVTVTATFFNSSDTNRRPTPDTVLPISKKNSAQGKSSTFELPADRANSRVSLNLPPNVNRAVVGITATGQAKEEFWYRNAFTSDVKKMNDEHLFGDKFRAMYPNGPFREVQLMVDGQLAGVAWPFPAVFTGGINPYFWRPMAGIDTFDLRESEIDITPWLGLLCDGNEHSFEIRMAGVDDDGRGDAKLGINQVEWNWVVSGNIFLFLGDESQKTQQWMSKPVVDTPPPTMEISSQFTYEQSGKAKSLDWSTKVNRTLSITAALTSDSSKKISWTQTLGFTNQNSFFNNGNSQAIQQRTIGLDASSPVGYVNAYDYPFTTNWTYDKAPDHLIIDATIDQGKTFNILGPSLFPSGIQDSSFGHSQNSCPLPADFKDWPDQMFKSGGSLPAAFLQANIDGEAHYSEVEKGELPYEVGSNDMNQDFSLNGLCLAADIDPEMIRQAAQQQQSQQSLESYSRKVHIVDDAPKVDDEKLLIGQSVVAVPSTEGILQWNRPQDSLSTSSNQATQPVDFSALLNSILGIQTENFTTTYTGSPLGIDLSANDTSIANSTAPVSASYGRFPSSSKPVEVSRRTR